MEQQRQATARPGNSGQPEGEERRQDLSGIRAFSVSSHHVQRAAQLGKVARSDIEGQ